MRFRYTGQTLLAPLGLYYYKARIYSPTLGRFLQTDPERGLATINNRCPSARRSDREVGTADDMNLYAYVGNNPVNGIDPTGLKVLALGSTPEATKLIQNSYAKLNQTTAGQKITKPLEESSTTYIIRDGSHVTEYNDSKKTVTMDMYNDLMIPTTAGNQPIPSYITLAHELGHANID